MKYRYDVALSYATENKDIVDKVYHYLRAEKITAFFAPSPEAQVVLSGQNGREIFYRIFGMESEYVVLFVSKYYVAKEVPIEEATIAFNKHNGDGKVIPIYLDGTPLPKDMFDPKSTNYFVSINAVEIASHLANRIKMDREIVPAPSSDSFTPTSTPSRNFINFHDNKARVMIPINELNIGGNGKA